MKKKFESIDFSRETIRVPLINPFYVISPREKKQYFIDGLVLRRMSAIELGALKTRITKYQKEDEMLAMMRTAVDIIELCTETFLSGGEAVKDVSNMLMLKRIRTEDILPLMFLSIMLIKGSSLFSTHYICKNRDCEAGHIHFNLNPDMEIPKNVESNRFPMQDFMDYLYVSRNVTGTEYFDLNLKTSGLKLIRPVYNGDTKTEETITAETYRFRYGTAEGFINVMEDRIKSKNPELYFFYDNLISINGLSEEETQAVKQKNGFDTVMRFDASDSRALTKEANRYGITIEHSFECPVCGTYNDQDFDMTNFFAYLTN